MSPQRSIERCAAKLGTEIRKIGKILNIRWVASSFRSVRAVWNNYTAMYKHFMTEADDTANNSKERVQFFAGLAIQLGSNEFLKNLALMHDALEELAHLSETLQLSNITLQRVHKHIKRQVEVFKNRKENGGEIIAIVSKCMQTNEYRAIKLNLGKQTELMKQKQFYQSLIYSIEARLLLQSESFLSSKIGILLPANWPDDTNVEYGEKELKLLRQKFLKLYDAELKSAYHDYKENNGTVTEGTIKNIY